MEGVDIWIDELPESYSAEETRELDKWTRALGRKWITKEVFTVRGPSTEKGDVAESLKRLHDRGYLTNVETQEAMKLFGGWPRSALQG